MSTLRKMTFKHLPFGTPEAFNAVIEVPIGSHLKYEYDETLDAISLDYVFSAGFHWPFNYGYIPQTRGGDGDMLDVFILTPYPLAVGTIVAARAVGMIELLDRGEEDNKIIAVPLVDTTMAKYISFEDLPSNYKRDFEGFFAELGREKQKTIEIIAFHGTARALSELQRCSL